MDFKMYGKISLGKESEKFHPYEYNEYESGWAKKTIRFNMIAGDNRHMLTVTSLARPDEKNDIYTFTKSYVNESGERVKGESIKIPFKERLTSKRLPEVADFRKFVVDLEQMGRREELKKAFDRVNTGSSLTDEELKALGIASEGALENEIAKSEKKHHEFISEWDYIDFLKKVLESDKYKNSTFYIRGHADYQYSDKNERVYESYIPQRVYLCEGAEPSSVASLDFYFNSNSLDTNSADEKKRYYVNGYIMERDNNRRDNIPVPTTVAIVVPEDDASAKDKKLVEGIKRKFTVDTESFWKLKIDVDMINGAQQQAVSIEDLPDEVKEDIEFGLTTLEEVQREMGMTYGERIREYRFKGLAFGQKSKAKDETAFTEDDMKIKPLEKESVDLFDDDDDEL